MNTREEQLKQAIEETVKELSKQSTAPDKDTPDWLESDIRNGVNAALSTPSILQHADPEIMKQAGWVKMPENKVLTCADCGKQDDTVKDRGVHGIACYKCHRDELEFEEDYK